MEQFTSSFHAGFTRYKRMSEEVAGGRFSAKTLRDRIEQMEVAMGMAGGDLPGGQNFGGGQIAIDGSPTGTRRHRLQQFGGSSSESLLRYKELSEQVADGSWAPKALRERLRQMSEAVGAGVADLPSGQNSRIGQGAIDGSPAETLLQRLQQFGASSSESLIRYKELSGKVAGGRWSPKALRDQIEASKKIGGNSDTATGHTPPPAFLASDDSKSASKGSTDTRPLSWLKDQARQALSSQENIEPGRALTLLRDMIKPSAAKPDEKWELHQQGKGLLIVA
jgi:hypothetical protein